MGRALGYSAIVDLSLYDGGGEAQFEPSIDGAATLSKLETALSMLLAGRAAEEIEFGEVSIGSGFGSGSDLAQATVLARNIDLQFGLGKLGPYYVDPADSPLYLAHGLVEPVAQRLHAAYARARAILEPHAPTLRAIASELAESGYLSAKDVDRIMLARAASARSPEIPVPALVMGAA